MKRLLASGLTRIYQIAPAFRDGDYTAQHRPEFRLLEWYRRGEDLPDLHSFASGWHTHLAQLIAQLEGAPRPPFWSMHSPPTTETHGVPDAGSTATEVALTSREISASSSKRIRPTSAARIE